jgi:hypothetical protein
MTDTPTVTARPQQSTLRALTGALPLTAAAVLAVLIALLGWPAARHQLGLSFTRQHESYVELYFADEAAARSCPTVAGRLELTVAVRSHLTGDRDLTWTGTVDGVRAGGGVLRTRPGAVTEFTAALPVPAGRYTAVVALAGRTERLAVHC